MSISELISLLERAKEAHGDVKVSGWRYDGQASAGNGVVAWISPDEHFDEALEFIEPKDASAPPVVFIHFA